MPAPAENKSPGVVIVGRPNVGKSALFNRLVGRRIAIVHDQPGITRDRLATRCEINGKWFQLWDTGGVIGRGETELSVEVHTAARDAITQSDLLLFLVNAQEGLTPVDQELARMLRRSGKPVVLVVNKVDHAKHEPAASEFNELGFDNPILVSAAHGRGVSELQRRIAELLPTVSDSPLATRHSPLKIAILGRPNAGKSSLINAVVREKRTLVSKTPGTTRDAVDIEHEGSGKHYVFIDTAGMRARSKHSSSVEVFSVMRAEKTIPRADLCVLVIDASEGVKAQDRRVAALIQKAGKPCLVVLNKWDLLRPARNQREVMRAAIERTRAELFFIDYAPILIASALYGEHVDRIFRMSEQIHRAARAHIGTGKLNRAMQAAFASNPPPLISGKRLKLFYATQAPSSQDVQISPPEFILFVNSPRLLTKTFTRFLEGKIREIEPYAGLPILLRARARM